MTDKNRTHHPSFAEAFRFWFLLGWISFGGPTGQIAIMYQELVEKRKWISHSRFLHALNYCMFLPGPEATQLAIYIGWLLHKVGGGLIAGIFFVLPSIFILWLLSYVYAVYGNVPWILSLFYGLKPAVVAIVASAVIKIGSKALKNEIMVAITALAFVAIFFFNVPFPLLIAAAALIGWVGGKLWREKFDFSLLEKQDTQAVIHDTLETPSYAKPSLRKAIKISLLGLTIWLAPLLTVGYFAGWDSLLFQEGLFFSKAALVTFGGAYAVLSYVAQYVVNQGWILPGQMIDGLGLAETTPGPLIMVLQFVGFLGAWRHPMGMNPLLVATVGAFLATWCTFVPCFLFIFLGAPYIEKFRGNLSLSTMLTSVTAAVVGVILNLAAWFGIQVIFIQQGGFDPIALLICLCAFIMMWRWNVGIIPVVLGSALFGILYFLWS